MLKSIYIESFRTLRKTKVDFVDGLNVIIGKNGAGKSNLLNFLFTAFNSFRAYGGSRAQLEVLAGSKLFYTKGDSKDAEQIEVSIEYKENDETLIDDGGYVDIEEEFAILVTKRKGAEITYKDTILVNESNEQTTEARDDFNELSNMWPLLIEYSSPGTFEYLNKPSSIVIEGGIRSKFRILYPSYPFLRSFETLFRRYVSQRRWSIEDTIEIKDKLTSSLEEAVNAINLQDLLHKFTNISSIRLSENVNIYSDGRDIFIENLIIEFNTNGHWVSWNNLSDGFKRLFEIVTLVAAIPYKIAFIEEPELGLHPHQFMKIMTFLKEQSKHKQIIISTHSPIALDCLEPRELNRIIIATINEKNVSQFRHLTPKEKAKAKTYMTEVGDLSSYWLHSDLDD